MFGWIYSLLKKGKYCSKLAMTGIEKAVTALVVAIIFPMSLQADTEQSGETWNMTDELIDQCNAPEVSRNQLSEIAKQLWNLPEIEWGLRKEATTCLNEYFDDEVVYTWDEGWQFIIRDDQLDMYPNSVKKLISEEKDFCAEFDDGTLKIPQSAIQKADLTGDGYKNYIFSSQNLICSSNNFIWSGSGGGKISLVVGDHVSTFFARDMEITYPYGSNFPIIIFFVHGSMCGGYGATSCMLATVWGDGKFEYVGREDNQ
jgi:hypothetical protein